MLRLTHWGGSGKTATKVKTTLIVAAAQGRCARQFLDKRLNFLDKGEFRTRVMPASRRPARTAPRKPDRSRPGHRHVLGRLDQQLSRLLPALPLLIARRQHQ